MTAYCTEPGCERPVENRERGLCATHNRIHRKIDSVKMPDDPKPIKKVSEIQSKMMVIYSREKKKFMLGRWCAVHGRNCIPTDIHHVRGRSVDGFADMEAEEKGIPLLLDKRYWLPVCREAHIYITDNSDWAKANGYSKDRLCANNARTEKKEMI